MTEKRKRIILVITFILLFVAWIAMEIIQEYDIKFHSYESGLIEIAEEVNSVEITIQGTRYNLYEAEAIEFIEFWESLEVAKETPKTPEMLADNGGIIVRFYENEQEISKYYILNGTNIYSYEKFDETRDLLSYKVKQSIEGEIETFAKNSK